MTFQEDIEWLERLAYGLLLLVVVFVALFVACLIYG